MILDEIVLHNFGVYGGRQAAMLTPTPGRPITLFGGLNGGGKTTLLDAFQLCLFGSAARCSSRSALGYDEFLRRSVHRGAETPEAALELEFRHTAQGSEQTWRLHRSWRGGNGSPREKFEVLRNGEPDALAKEHWSELVEDLIPSRIAHLFLFDGEKVESYAELDEAPALIATAIQNLLGLDLVERLAADLVVLERRKRNETRAPSDQARWEEARRTVVALEEARDKLVARQGAVQNRIDTADTELAAIEKRYRQDGGHLFDRRAELEGEVQALERELAQVRRELNEEAAGAAPFLLVKGLIESVSQRDAREEGIRQLRNTTTAIDHEHTWLLNQPELMGLPAEARTRLLAALQGRQSHRREAAAAPTHLDLGAEARAGVATLLGFELREARKRGQSMVARERQCVVALDRAKDNLAAAPGHDVISALLVTRAEAMARVASLRAEQQQIADEIDRLGRDIEQAREREARLGETEARRTFAEDDIERTLRHSGKVRATLTRFRGAVVERHVARIQELVLTSFQNLVRKPSLVGRLEIDPQTFEIRLFGGDDRLLTPERLSAGERQLLAIAILWGLGRASGRPLPTIIDTPLGRLDSVHRSHLVERYFPNASHQVLLLSTDEEIMGRYLEALRPSINRTYSLRYDEDLGRTLIEPGYLERGEADGH